ncbi:MAG: TonB-dependent receptor [Bryobacterales bacterium]|nr:TonB-dependent receptor [Bryobacterales bacterium]
MRTTIAARLLLLSMVLAMYQTSAQEFRATISGHIYDSSGGAVPNAKIQVVNLANSETTNATSDTSGTYTVPFLRPGEYKITVTASGFKTAVRDKVTLQVAQVSGIDITLEVGSLSESVEVTADAALLETQTASRSGVVTNQQVAELPLNARNPFMLGVMMPGVTFRGAAIWQRPFDNGAIAQWSVNGSRDSSTEFMMDGASNNGQAGGNNIAYVPIVDAVQEFSMQLNLYNAEYGKTGGGIMNVVLKSGTNQFHATGWEFMRRTPLDANTFQNNAIPASASNPSGGAPRPNHYLDQYGFQLEGPVYIPKLLKKDAPVKLFYLGSFENYREGTPNPLFVSYPEPEMRQGDFSKLTNASGQPMTIYNPFDCTANCDTNPVRSPFPGNKIPASMLNPIALNVTKYMPLPNRPAPAGTRYANSNLALPGYFDADKFYNLILKFDWNFGDRHRAFFRHASNDRTEDRAVNGIDNKPGTDGQQPFQRINDAYAIDYVGTLTPTLVINLRGSYNRFIEKGFGRANEGFDVSSFGLPQSLISQLPGPIYFGRWNFYSGTSGSSGVYNSLGRGQSNNYTNSYQLSASITKIWGKHSMKGGVDIRQINYLIQNTGDILAFNNYTSYTQKSWNQADATSGDPYAAFLLGLPDGSSNYPLFPWWRNWYTAFYFQDDWKIARRLTINLGLRNDLNYPANEKWNRMNGPFDANVASPLASQFPPAMLAQYPQLASLKGGITFAGVNGIPSRPAHLNKNNWQPRAGFAYEINSKLVMRGGVGLYFSNPNNDYFQTAGFSTSTSLVSSTDGGRTPIRDLLSNPYPNGISVPTGSSLGALTFVGRNNDWFDSSFRTPRVWSFSYGFQYQVNSSSTMEVTYVGSRSSNLNMQKDYNIPSLDFRKQCNIQEGGSPNYCDQQVPNPFKGINAFLGTSYYSSNTLSRFQMARIFPQFNGVMTQRGRNDSNIWYNSLQVSYNMRVRGGINLVGNYNYSKEIEKWGFNDPFNNVYQQGVYLNDRPHVLKLTAVYDLPFGPGKTLGSGISNGFVKRLISGWTASAFYQNSMVGEPTDLPVNVMMLKDPRTPGGGWDGNINFKAYQPRAWNPCVLRQFNDGRIEPTPTSVSKGCGAADSGQYAWLWIANGPANAGSGGSYAPRYTPFRSSTVRKHHAYFLDASVTKMTTITERLRLQFGFEAFNLFNHNYFGRDSYNSDPNNPLFGTITPSTVSTQNMLPRQIQIRMKLFW